MISFKSNIPLFSSCLDNLSIFENGVLKHSLSLWWLFCGFRPNRQHLFYEIGLACVWCTCGYTYLHIFFFRYPLTWLWAVRSRLNIWGFSHSLSSLVSSWLFQLWQAVYHFCFSFTSIWLVVHSLLCGRGSKQSWWRGEWHFNSSLWPWRKQLQSVLTKYICQGGRNWIYLLYTHPQ